MIGLTLLYDITYRYNQINFFLHPCERVVAILPIWTPLPYTGWILDAAEAKTEPITKGLMTTRPQYGGRGAPLRRLLKLSEAFRRHHWRQARSDVCLPTKRADSGRLVGLLLIRVDDAIVAGAPNIWPEFESVVKEYKTGDFKLITLANPHTFLGSQIVKRGSFWEPAKPIATDNFHMSKKFLNKGKKGG